MPKIIDLTNSLEEARAPSLASSIEITFIIKCEACLPSLPIVLKKEVENITAFKDFNIKVLLTLEPLPLDKFNNRT